jgi:hypothetical protein
MKQLFIVAVIITMCTGSLEAAEGKWIQGEGLSSCGSWTHARQRNWSNRMSKEQWVAGYLSSANTFMEAMWGLLGGGDSKDNSPDFLKGGDWEGEMVWIDNYCRAKPLNQISQAAAELSMELIGRHLPPKPASR